MYRTTGVRPAKDVGIIDAPFRSTPVETFGLPVGHNQAEQDTLSSN